MAVRSSQVTVGTTAVVLAPLAVDDARSGFDALIVNRGTTSVFVGGSGVTTSTGLEVPVGTSLTVTMSGPETVYGISPSGTNRVDVATVGTG